TGVATFSLCGSSYDTKLAVYDGTECPETNLPPDPVELQAGEDISTAVAIPSLPVKLTGTTAGYLYDYDPSCGGTGTAPDVVYSYTPASDIYAYIELCGTTWDTRMIILDGDGVELACNDDHCSLQSGFDNFAMSAGLTYYIVIGGYSTYSGAYLFTMYTTNYILLGCNDNFCSNQSELHLPVVTGSQYLIEVGGSLLNAGAGLLTVRCDLPPDNDDCANATPIGNVTDLAFSTTSATHDGADPWILSPNIWYIYTPTCTGLATFSLCGSGFDTKLVVYDGATCDPLPDTLGRDDDACDPGLQSVMYKSVIQGNQYLIEVGGYSATTIGDGVISTSCDLPPVNDNCESVNPADNVLISETPVVFTGNNSAASNDCPQGTFADTWLAFTTTECMNVVINSCGMDPNLTNTVGLRLYDSCPCGAYITANSYNWTDCGDDNWTLYFDRLPAGAYYYAIYSSPPTGPYSFTVTGVTCPPPVDGESCEHPLTINLSPGVPYVTDGTTCGMWNDYSNTCLGSYDGGEDVIYEVTVPTDGCYSFMLDPQGTTYTGIALDAACPLDPTACIAYHTQYAATTHGFRADLTTGTTYWLMIDTYPTPTCIPAFTLTIQECPPPPVNDHCDAAIQLEVPSITDATTESADMDSDFPTCTVTITGPGVWYKVLGTGNTMTATTCNAVTAYDTKLNVYCYTCGQPICVGGNDDACTSYSLRSTVSWCSDPTATYLILVQGYGGNSGVFELELSDDGVPCTGAIACGFPEFVVDPTSVQMTLPPNGSGTQPLVITNTGDATLTGTAYVTVNGPAPSPLLRPSQNDFRMQVSTEQVTPLKVDDGAVSNPDPRVILQGGDNCADAFDLGNTVPVSDAGTTTGYTHNYGPFTARPACWQGNWLINASASVDVAYKWTAPYDSTYTFSLCGSGYDTGLLLYNYTCPTEPTEADLICGNDDASTCASTLRSELVGIPLTAGQEVLIVVGGYNTANGAYALEISAYTPPPPPPGCPDGTTVVGQAPTLTTEAWTFGTTDVDPAYIRYDNFAGLSSEINEIHFWGIQGYNDGTAWSVCSTDPESFQIIFYNDAGGVPGDVINTFDVSISPVPTGNTFTVGSVSFEQMEFVATLPSTVRLFRGWVSIQGTSTGDNCWFLWQNSLSADHVSLLSDDGGGTFTTATYDLSMCLVGSNFTPWLSVDPVTFSVPAGMSTVINAHANAGGLAPGVYTGAVRMTTNVVTNPLVTVPVQLTVSPMGIIQGIAYNVDGVTSLPNVHVVTYDAGNNVVDDQISNAVGIWSVALAPGTYHEHLTKTGFIAADITNIIVTVGNTTNVSFNMQLNTQGGCHYRIGDANGSGTFTGLDVTYSVRYFKGGPHPPYICECTPGNTWYVSGDVNGSCTFSGLDVTYMVRYFKGGAAPICCPSCPPVPDILKLSPNPVDNGLQDGAGQ
ncbi:MAG TPA: hypothetical protein DCZ43_04480, partial [candidate division Zixibacteria bacterium]|nr:hypothetical protein [candidate division Zixibacteria bacterium]